MRNPRTNMNTSSTPYLRPGCSPFSPSSFGIKIQEGLRPRDLAKRGRASKRGAEEQSVKISPRESRRQVMAFPPPHFSFPSFFHLPQKWKKGYYCKLLRLAHSVILKGTLFHPENTEERRVGNFLPIFLRHHESPSEKRPRKGLRLGTRPGTVPTEPIKATTRTEWQLGGRSFSRGSRRRQRQIRGIPITFRECGGGV